MGVAPRPPNSFGQLMPGVPGVEQHALPAGVPGAAGGPVVAVGLGRRAPGSTSSSQARSSAAELPLFGGVAEIHRPGERI